MTRETWCEITSGPHETMYTSHFSGSCWRQSSVHVQFRGCNPNTFFPLDFFTAALSPPASSMGLTAITDTCVSFPSFRMISCEKSQLVRMIFGTKSCLGCLEREWCCLAELRGQRGCLERRRCIKLHTIPMRAR